MDQTGTLPQCGNVGWLRGEHQCTDGWVAMHRLVVFRVSIGYLGFTLLLRSNGRPKSLTKRSEALRCFKLNSRG